MSMVDFSRGELSPTMRYRKDLDAYYRGVEILERFLPTPRGGLARGPGSQVLELLPPSDAPPAVRIFSLGSTGLDHDIPKVGDDLLVEFGDAIYEVNGKTHDIPKSEELEILLSFTEYGDADDVVAYWINTPDGDPTFLQRVWNYEEGEGYTFPAIDFEDTRDVRVAQVENHVYIVALNQIYRIYWDALKSVPEWSGSTPYKERDVIWREDNAGKVMFFECIEDHTGDDPAGIGSTHWRAVYRPYLSWEIVSPRIGHELVEGPDDNNNWHIHHNATWADNHDFKKGDVVVRSSEYYECINNHTSDGTPPESDATNWQKVEEPEGVEAATYMRSTYAYREETVPREMVAHHNRLIFAGSSARPSTAFGSEVYNYLNFGQGIKDSEPWIVKISGDKVGRILWLAVTDQLYLGTSGGIFAVDGVITPTQFQLRKVTSHATSSIHAVSAAGSIIFFHKDEQTLREIEYADQAENYRAFDLTVFSNHLFEEFKAMKMVVVNDPMIVIWILREDGTLVSLSYEKTVDMFAFARHELYGSVFDLVAGKGGDLFAVVEVLEYEAEEKNQSVPTVRQLIKIGRKDIVDGDSRINDIRLDGLISYVNTSNENLFRMQIPDQTIADWYIENGILSIAQMFNWTGAFNMSGEDIEADVSMGGFDNFSRVTSFDISDNKLHGTIPVSWQSLGASAATDVQIDISDNPIERWDIAEAPGSWKTISVARTSLNEEQIKRVVDSLIAGGRSDIELDLSNLGPISVEGGISLIHGKISDGWTVLVDNDPGWEDEYVQFVGNGADSGSVSSIHCYLGQEVTLPGNAFNRENFVFTGWAIEVSPDVWETYIPGNKYRKEVQGSIEFVAQWIANNEVFYNASGGSGSVTDPNKHNEGDVVVVQPGAISKTGYTFGGWTMDSQGLGRVYIAGDTFVMPDHAVTLYAKLTPKTFVVSYSSNDATHGKTPGQVHATFDSTFTVAGSDSPLHKVQQTGGGKFVSWNTRADGNGTTWKPGDTFTYRTDGSTTLYAQYGPYNVGDNGPGGGIIVKDFGSYATRSIVHVGGNFYESPQSSTMRFIEMLRFERNPRTLDNQDRYYEHNGETWLVPNELILTEVLHLKMSGLSGLDFIGTETPYFYGKTKLKIYPIKYWDLYCKKIELDNGGYSIEDVTRGLLGINAQYLLYGRGI